MRNIWFFGCMGRFKKYKNPYISRLKRTPLHFLAWFLGFYKEEKSLKVPVDFSYPRLDAKDEGEGSAFFVNHCTYYLNVHDVHFLTDPIWSERCSPFSFFGPKRLHEPALKIDEIEKLDYVLISHNHYDHLDLRTIKSLKLKFPNAIFIVPKGLKRWFNRNKIKNVRELNWWESSVFTVEKGDKEIEIAAVPAQHHSGRSFFDSNRTLWAGFVATVKKGQSQKRFYFAGDTGYNPFDFKEIGRMYPGIDLSICPIGTYLPRKFMRSVHVSPQDAVSIHVDTKTKKSLGMHWGTFNLSEEDLDAPPYDLYQEMKKREIDFSLFLPILPGESVNW